MKKAVLLLSVLVGFGCQQEPQRSSFDDWQPPPYRSQRVLKSDAVVLHDKPGPAVMPKVSEPKQLQKPLVGLIVVSIREQRLRVYSGEELLKEFVVSTAVGGQNLLPEQKSEKPHNHIGSFTIDRKDVDHVSGEYHCPMPYALHFYEGHWIHATEPKFYHKLGSPASHGCIRLHLSDAQWLYSHTPVGCKLYITAD